MIKLTPLFAFFIVLIFSQATNIPGLIFISMVIQSGSIINIITPIATITGTPGYGLTPFHGMAFFIVIAGFVKYFNLREYENLNHLRTPIIFLIFYVIWCGLGSFVWPYVFENLPINSLIQMYGVNNLTPLTWNISHIVQAITLFLILALLISILILCNSTSSRRKFLYGFIIAYIFVFFVGIYEQIAKIINYPSFSSYIANNIGYHQAPTWAGNSYSSLERIGLPFSEPSYASVYMAAVFIGCVVSAFFGRRWYLWSVASIFSLLGLINTFGSTGIAAAIGAFLIFGSWIISTGIQSKNYNEKRKRTIIFLGLLVLLLILFILINKFTDLGSQMQAIFKGLILDKAMGTDGSSRGSNNLRAFQILLETYGLGAGLGSHRASSYFASLLANTGLLGFVFFMGMLSTLLWRYWKSIMLSDIQIFIASALATATLGMGLGIPDLNMPMYWGFIILSFVFCPDDAQLKRGINAHGCLHPQDNRQGA